MSGLTHAQCAALKWLVSGKSLAGHTRADVIQRLVALGLIADAHTITEHGRAVLARIQAAGGG